MQIVLLLSSFLVSIFCLMILEFVLIFLDYPYIQCDKVEVPLESVIGRFDEDLGWTNRENLSFKTEDVWYHIDQNGIRVPEPGFEHDFSKPVILLVGDSVTFGHRLNFSETLGNQLSQKLEDKFTVINIGVDGYGTDQSALKLQKNIDILNPEKIIHIFITDHLRRNINNDRREFYPCLSAVGTKPQFAYKNGSLIQQSFPKEIRVYDSLKINVMFKRFYNLFTNEKKVNQEYHNFELTNQLLNKIDNVGDIYYILYDNHNEPPGFHDRIKNELFLSEERKILNFSNWDDYPIKEKYAEGSSFHPSGETIEYLLTEFLDTFGDDFDIDQ